MNEPKVKLGRVFEKVSAKGTRYFTGRLGAARILMFQSRETADNGDPVWDLYLQEVEDTRPQASQGERPRRRAERRESEPASQGEPFHDDPLDDVLPFEGG